MSNARALRRGVRQTERTIRYVAKKTSGTLNALLVGDSVGDGVGAIPTGSDDGSGTAFGGSAPPSGCRLLETDTGASFAVAAVYPDGGGTGNNPGLVPHIHYTALELGFTGCDVYRYAVSSAPTATVRNQWWAAKKLLIAAGVVEDLTVVVAGTNNSGVGESSPFNTLVGTWWPEIEWLSGSRSVWVHPITTAQAEADAVRTYIDAHVAVRPTLRARVAGAGLPGNDASHPNLATYRTQGRSIIPAYLALPT